MPVQQSHKSKRATRTRKAHNRLEAVQVTTCPTCGAPCLPHRVCKACGNYGGKQVLNIKEKAEA
ncbi:MAG: 50S ribosomal protein L32 [Victivallales bacterium]|nr:50S ribosomal protein L32 [Victivallales bacterium]